MKANQIAVAGNGIQLKGKKLAVAHLDARISALGMMPGVLEAKPERVVEIPWDCPVFPEKLFTASGVDTGIFGVIARPEDDSIAPRYVGQYRRGENIVRNADLVSQTESALARLGWDYTKKITLFRDGAGFQAEYIITRGFDVGTNGIIGHSRALPTITIKNSYDGKWKVTGEFGIQILLCLNGAVGIANEVALLHKHSSKLSLDVMQGAIGRLVEDGAKSAPSLERMADVKLDDQLAYNFFGNVAQYSKGAISKRQAAQMFNAYLAPDEHEAKLEPTAWRAFMAGTRAMRDLRTVRPTVADTANHKLGQIATFMVSTPKAGSAYLHGFKTPAAQLLAPLPAKFDLVEVDLDEMAVA